MTTPTDRTYRWVAIVTIVATLCGCLVAIHGIITIHADNTAFDRGLKQAKAHCAALGKTWMPDNIHKGYDHPVYSPGYCVEPQSILFGYPEIGR